MVNWLSDWLFIWLVSLILHHHHLRHRFIVVDMKACSIACETFWVSVSLLSNDHRQHGNRICATHTHTHTYTQAHSAAQFVSFFIWVHLSACRVCSDLFAAAKRVANSFDYPKLYLLLPARACVTSLFAHLCNAITPRNVDSMACSSSYFSHVAYSAHFRSFKHNYKHVFGFR